MKTLKSFVLLLLLLAFAATGSAQKLQIPPHEKVVLKNGLTVLLLEKRGVPIVDVSVLIKTGAIADPAGQEGLASITAGLLRKGSKSRTAQQFAADIDFIGGSFDADAGADYSSASAEFLTKDIAKGFELLSDALLHPTFPQEEVDKLLAQSIDGVKASKDSASSVIIDYYEAYLYDGKGYGRPTGGDEVSLKRIKRDSIVKFYETYYAPENTILAVAGDFNATEVKKKIEDTFGAWPTRPTPVVKWDSVAPAKGKRFLLVNKSDATQTFFVFGNIETTATDPDRVAIRVVNTVFGSRFTSMLNEALRVESGLSYGAGSFFRPAKMPGFFAIYSFTRNETTEKALDVALQTLKKLHADGLTAEPLASAKSYMKGQFPPTVETAAQLAHLIASNEFYGLTDDEVNLLDARIDAVTPEIAKQVIAKHFPSEDLVFVLIGKGSDIAPGVKKFADKQDSREITAPGFWPGSK
jgi:zinc protease